MDKSKILSFILSLLILLTVSIGYAKNKKARCPKGMIKDKAGFCIKTSCPKGYVKGPHKKCVKKCPKNYRLAKGPLGEKRPYCVRKKCLKGQFRATDDRCYCPGGYFLPQGVNKCVPERCPKGFIRGSDWSCIKKCPNGKIWDSNKKQCITKTCPNGMYFSLNKNECVCKKGYHKGLGNYCVPNECPINHYRAVDGKCYRCPKGKFRPKSAQFCVPRYCPQGTKRDPKSFNCVSICDPGKVWSKKLRKCIQVVCDPGSKLDPSTGECTQRKCPKGMVRDPSGQKCVKTKCGKFQYRDPKTGDCRCKQGYKLKILKNKEYCVPIGCGTFAYPKHGKCVKCPRGYYRPSETMKRCVKCPKGRVINKITGQCELPPCPKGKIRPQGKTYCVYLTCPKGTKRDKNTRKCKKIKCKRGFRLAKTQDKCVLNKCPKGMIRDINSEECVYPPCPKGKIRSSKSKKCVPMSCPKGAKRNKISGECECPKGMRLEPQGKYCVKKRCSKREYRASDFRCYPCKEGYYRPRGFKYCVPEMCPKGSKRNPKTLKCVCPANMTLSLDRKKCVPKICPEGKIKNATGDCICKNGYMPVKGKNYCVPKDCGEAHYRDKYSKRCVPCPKGKFRPEGIDKCIWKPCPSNTKRGSNGSCVRFGRCRRNEFKAPDGGCVPKVCPKGTKRDPASAYCIPTKSSGTNSSKQKSSAKTILKSRDCPDGFIPRDGWCIPKTCPNGTKRDKKTGACFTPKPKQPCKKGFGLNPMGQCVPLPCPYAQARPVDTPEKCLPFKKGWRKPCKNKGMLRDRLGRCIKPKRLKCPKSSTRVGNRCYYL